jgi:hypothetical protein
MRSPEALAMFLEACDKVILERAGVILEEMTDPANRRPRHSEWERLSAGAPPFPISGLPRSTSRPQDQPVQEAGAFSRCSRSAPGRPF